MIKFIKNLFKEKPDKPSDDNDGVFTDIKTSFKKHDEKLPCITLIFKDKPSIEKEKIENTINEIEKLKHQAKIKIMSDDSKSSNIMGLVKFGKHEISLVFIDAPLPKQTLENTLTVSHWPQEDKQKVLEHKSHVLCYYSGEDDNTIEQYIALYKVATAFNDSNMIGVINEPAGTYNPAKVIDTVLSLKMLNSLRDPKPFVPLKLWTGFIKMTRPDGKIWMRSKGNHFFGIKDFAYLANDHSESTTIFQIFEDIFFYLLHSKTTISIGHTLQISTDTFLKFNDVTEYNDYLEGPLGTVVIEKINASEINK